MESVSAIKLSIKAVSLECFAAGRVAVAETPLKGFYMKFQLISNPCLLIPLAAAQFLATCVLAAEDTRETTDARLLESIEAGWRAREERVRSAEFAWTEVRTTRMAPAESAIGGPFGLEDAPPSTEATSEQRLHLHQYRQELALQGEKYRFRDSMPGLTFDRSEYEMPERLFASDGEVRWGYFESTVPKTTPYFGTVRHHTKDAVSSVAMNLSNKVLFLHLRPSVHSPDLFSQADVSAPRAVLGEMDCVVIAAPGLRGAQELFWLDADLQFSMRRFVRRVADSTVMQIDVTYDVPSGDTPIPMSWKILQQSANGDFHTMYEAEVLVGKINQDIDEEHFAVNFPANTLVADYVHNSLEGIPGSSQAKSQTSAMHADGGPDCLEYLVRADGTKRLVLANEMRRISDGQELIDTDTGFAGLDDQQAWRSPWFLWGVMLALLLFVGVLVRWQAKTPHIARVDG
ncbi:MAG: hypothetical protein KJ000_23140 [Pirellulaceae bacterium]|nr:hypothetical protein [Pirellulaceae bacterium]